MKNKVIFYPENLNIKSIIEQDVKLTPTQKKISLKYYQRILYPVSRIIFEYKLNKSFSTDMIEEVYVPLNTKLLMKLFGSNSFFFILPLLLRNNVLVKNKKRYFSGSHSDSYRLGDAYIKSLYTKEILNIHTDKTLYNNLTNRINLNDKYINKVYMSLCKIKINGLKAVEILTNKINEIKMGEKNKFNINNINNNINSSSILCYLKSSEEFVNQRFIDEYFDSIRDVELLDSQKQIDVFNSWFVNISKILEKDWFISVGINSGRVFTNITSLPRELRSCLYIETPNKGNKKNDVPKSLYEVDIANSQPFLFNKFLLDYYNLEDDIFGEKYEDIRKYISLTSKGELYEYLMNEFGLTDRESFKKQFFGNIFYCKKSSNLSKKQSKMFGELFPNIMSLVLKMKETNYKNLSIQLQKFEVEIIINKISKTLYKNKIEHYTIHDSIMCFDDDKDFVYDLMKKEFNKIDLRPTLKIKKI